MKAEKFHFRIDTPAFFQELNDGILQNGNNGVLSVPFRIFAGFLDQIAKRSTELNDPILNRIMFDMNLYDLPAPTTPEYSKLMKQVYKEAEKQKTKEAKLAKKKTITPVTHVKN